MAIIIYCLLIIGVLVGAAGFSINKRALVVTRHNNNAMKPRQIINHHLSSSRPKAANSFPSFKMMSTTDDESEMIEDNTDVIRLPITWKRVFKTLCLGQTTCIQTTLARGEKV